MARESWLETPSNAVVSGAIASASTLASAAARGRRDSGSAIAAVNAISHIVWGRGASSVRVADVKHTLPALLLNTGATVFWAGIYERVFGRAAREGHLAKAVAGGGAVAALAYVTDYHLVPKRLTPGWEERVSRSSLGIIYGVLALSLPLYGLLQSSSAQRLRHA